MSVLTWALNGTAVSVQGMCNSKSVLKVGLGFRCVLPSLMIPAGTGRGEHNCSPPRPHRSSHSHIPY